VEATQPLVRQREHELRVLAPPAPLLVEVDPSRMEQVFINLINNAAKYTPPGGRLWVKCTTEGEEIVAHIEDNGVGIPHEMLPRIFDLFTQVESERALSQGGLGIGLALVKNLVSLHDGTVQVRSEGPGKGAEFSVRLRASKLDPAARTGSIGPSEAPGPSVRLRSIASTGDPASAGKH
jgi:signal transduction histidine kinase